MSNNNVDRPNGFRPVGTLSGSPWHGSIRAFTVDAGASAIFRGDLVNIEADGAIDQYDAADTQVVGVCIGVDVDRSIAVTEHPGYWPATTAGTDVILVATAPDLLMEVQEDGLVDPLELLDVGANIEIIDGGGSTLTGVSGMELNSDSHATTNTLPLRIIRFVNRDDNVLGDDAAAETANARWLVTFANHAWKGLNVGI